MDGTIGDKPRFDIGSAVRSRLAEQFRGSGARVDGEQAKVPPSEEAESCLLLGLLHDIPLEPGGMDFETLKALAPFGEVVLWDD